MRKLVIILLIFIITILNGCSNVHESNNFEDSKQPLTKAQIDEIITAATESVIVDVDFSQISKPNPLHQTEINERMQCLAEKLKGKVTMENASIVVARVNGETITASDWYREKINKILQAEYNNKSIPSDAEILNDLIETKVISSTARSLGIYPPEDQVKAYIADQQKYMEILKPEEITILIQAWGISEEDYFLLMEDRIADSLAKINWGVYLEKYEDEVQEDDQGYVAKSPFWIDDDKIKPLLEKTKVEVTSEGRQLGISY
ncbi:MAG: SurA N-terminal domain-containing protein [Methanocorpusculum sp.]|nr:SurA N-terminal domain-containing protein [Methanocorpusculum sp.]